MFYKHNPKIAVVLAGGYGRRIPQLSELYGCKSLIPVHGKPLVTYVLASLMSVHRGQIIVCVDREELLSTFKSLLCNFNNKQLSLFQDSGPGSTIAIVREVAEKYGQSSMCVAYGHQPISPSHFQRILTLEETTLGLSTYKSSSASTRKVLVSNSEKVLNIRSISEKYCDDNSYYAEVPYALPREFIANTIAETSGSSIALSSWITGGLPVRAMPADSPHEFHHETELNLVQSYVDSQKIQLRRTNTTLINEHFPNARNLSIGV